MKKLLFFSPSVILSLFLISVLTSCNLRNNQGDVSTAETESDDLNTPLIYAGTLPCADCPGINYQLVIEENQFTEISQYQDRSAERFEETGTWKMNGDTVTLIGLENLILKRFLITEENLTLLNIHNQKITGDLADMYILDRSGNQESIREHHEKLGEQGYLFFAAGNEPFWSLNIDSLHQIIFKSPEKELHLGQVDLSTIKREMQFERSADSTRLTVQIQDKYCQDSMSGYLFPLTITATMQSSDVDSLNGCGLFLDSSVSSNVSDSIQ